MATIEKEIMPNSWTKQEPELLDFVDVLIKGQKRAYNAQRKPYGLLHNTDLTGCLTQTAYQKIEKVREFNKATLMFYLFGEIIDSKVKTLASWANGEEDDEIAENFKKYLGPEFAVKEELIWHNMVFRPDVLRRRDNVVIETKTARSPSVKYAPKTAQVDQLKNYMAVFNAPYGIMFYVLAIEYEEPLIQHYIFMSEEEKMQRLDNILRDKELLQTAIDHNDVSGLPKNGATDIKFQKQKWNPSTREWYPTGESYLCSSCPFKDKCNPPTPFKK